MRLLVCGDTHMNTFAINNVAVAQAKKHGCTDIFQVGDFGFWTHEPEGVQFIKKVSKYLVKNGMTLYWIDGNHDNHPKLWAEYAPEAPYGFCRIAENLWYVPRGTVWQWNNVRFLGLGGAWSIDSQWRLNAEKARGMPGTLWWPTETIREQDIEAAIENLEGLPVDVMFSHDCPTGPDIPGVPTKDMYRWPLTWENRLRVRRVFDQAQPQLLVHGHYHVRYTEMLAEPYDNNGLLDYRVARVEGLANDGLDGFAIVLDLDALFPQY